MRSIFRLAVIFIALTGCTTSSPLPVQPSSVEKLPQHPEQPQENIVKLPVSDLPPSQGIPEEKTTADKLTIGTQLQIFKDTGDASKARQAVETQVGLDKLTAADKGAYAGLLLAEGDLKKAKLEFKDVLTTRPLDRDALFSMAFISGAEGDKTQQQIFLDRLQKAYPEDPEVYSAQGLFYYTQKNPEKASSLFQKSLNLGDNSEAREGLARLALDKKDWQEALKQLAAGILLDPTRDSLYSLESRAHMGEEKYLEAEISLNKALDLAPANPWHLLDRARLRWRDLYKPEGAMADIQEILKQEPQNFFALVYQAEIYESRDQAKEAYQNYVKVLELRPDYKYAYASMAILAFQNKDWERAQSYGQKSWKTYPGEYAFPWLSALSLRQLNRPNDAKALLENAYKQYGKQPLIQEMCRFLLTPTAVFNLDASLAKEKNLVVKTRLQFYQGFQYMIMNRPKSARALWEEVSQEKLRNVPEIRMAKDFLADLPE